MGQSVCMLFGIITYRVHMSTYQEVKHEMGAKSPRLWIPTRASTKSMWPGYLDNTVAGGIPSRTPIFEVLVKECMEEAILSKDLVQAHPFRFLIDLFICLGYIISDNKPDFMKIVTHLHTQFDYERWLM
ncbi:hypothetical protein B0H14DRAFT_2606647 [Mycena olivaceomarginata]|nr:hypothetical protein B0H14DRAFT_2606647 [Mycena olivaceomarginata]